MTYDADRLLADMTAVSNAMMADAIAFGYRPGSPIRFRRGTRAHRAATLAFGVYFARVRGMVSARDTDLVAFGWNRDLIRAVVRADDDNMADGIGRFRLIAGRLPSRDPIEIHFTPRVSA